jgi:hypothetical protein
VVVVVMVLVLDFLCTHHLKKTSTPLLLGLDDLLLIITVY